MIKCPVLSLGSQQNKRIIPKLWLSVGIRKNFSRLHGMFLCINATFSDWKEPERRWNIARLVQSPWWECSSLCFYSELQMWKYSNLVTRLADVSVFGRMIQNGHISHCNTELGKNTKQIQFSSKQVNINLDTSEPCFLMAAGSSLQGSWIAEIASGCRGFGTNRRRLKSMTTPASVLPGSHFTQAEQRLVITCSCNSCNSSC